MIIDLQLVTPTVGFYQSKEAAGALRIRRELLDRPGR